MLRCGVPTPYDEVPYPTRAVAATSPDRLAVVATVFGLTPADPRTARVLELGCGDGGNLLPHAALRPGCAVVGVDLSARQLARGRARIAQLGLVGASLHEADLATWEPEEGAYDYVICHGVLSWVPPALHGRILDLCRAALAPHGVAAVSFNTWPGFYARGALRDLALAFATGDLRADAAAARDAMRALVASLGGRTPWARVLAMADRVLDGMPDSYVAHEYLEPDNTALWLHELVDAATDRGLRYLGEPSLTGMLGHLLDPAMRRRVATLATDVVGVAQYADFFAGRPFRTALLVRDDASVQRDLHRFDASALHVLAMPDADPAIVGDVPGADALIAGALSAWPATVPFGDAGPAVAQWALAAECHDVLRLYAAPIPCAGVSERPVAWAWARAEVAEDHVVTSQWHVPVALEPDDLLALSLADGTRSKTAIEAELAAVGARRAAVTGEALTPPADALRSLSEQGLLCR